MAELLTLGAIGVVVAAAWRFLRGLGRRPSYIGGGEQEALRLLEQQYSRGEIDRREFEERREALFRR